MFKNWPLVTNLQFLSNPHEIWLQWLPHEVINFPKFQEDWTKIVDFLLMANFWKCPVFLLQTLDDTWSPYRKQSILKTISKLRDQISLRWQLTSMHSKFVGHSTEIIQQSKIKGPLSTNFFFWMLNPLLKTWNTYLQLK